MRGAVALKSLPHADIVHKMPRLIVTIAIAWLVAAPTLCRAGVLGGCCASESSCGTQPEEHEGCPTPESDCIKCADVCTAAFKPSEKADYHADIDQPCDVLCALRAAPAVCSGGAFAPSELTVSTNNPGCYASSLPLLI